MTDETHISPQDDPNNTHSEAADFPQSPESLTKDHRWLLWIRLQAHARTESHSILTQIGTPEDSDLIPTDVDQSFDPHFVEFNSIINSDRVLAIISGHPNPPSQKDLLDKYQDEYLSPQIFQTAQAFISHTARLFALRQLHRQNDPRIPIYLKIEDYDFSRGKYVLSQLVIRIRDKILVGQVSDSVIKGLQGLMMPQDIDALPPEFFAKLYQS